MPQTDKACFKKVTPTDYLWYPWKNDNSMHYQIVVVETGDPKKPGHRLVRWRQILRGRSLERQGNWVGFFPSLAKAKKVAEFIHNSER